jgi:predicted transcriptional regulator
MTYTFTHDELFNPKFNASTIIVLSVLKTLLNEKEIVCNNDLFERLPISEKTIYRSIKTLKENGIILNKKGKRKSKMKPNEIKNEN